MDIERWLIAVVAEITRFDGVGPATRLAAIGLRSIMAARLMLEVELRYGFDMPADWLADCGTVAELAERIDASRAEGASLADGVSEPNTAPAVDPDLRFALVALTPLQEAYLVGKAPSSSPDVVGCHHYRELTLGQLDVDRLRRAWQEVIDQHDALRLIQQSGKQRVRPDGGDWRLVHHDLAAASQAAWSGHLASVRRRMSHRLYAPQDWPMFSIEVSSGPGDSGSVIHFSIDGLVTDGYGLELLLDHWGQCYQRPGTILPSAHTHLAGLLAGLARQRAGAKVSADLAYWKARLAAMPAGPAVLAEPVPASPAGSPCLRRAPMTGSLTVSQWRELRAKASRWQVSPTSLVLTLFSEALARYSGSRRFSLVITTSDRLRLPAQAAACVAPLASTMVAAVDLTAIGSIEDTARRLHRELWAGLGHSSVSGVDVLRVLARQAPDRTAPALPVVFTSMLDLQPQPSPAGFGDQVSYAVSQTSGVALDHQMWEQDGELLIRWDVTRELLAPEAPETIFSYFVNGLTALAAPDRDQAADAERPLNDLQQAFFVARIAGAGAVPSGCQIYQSFRIDAALVGRLSRAWLGLVEAYEPLRTTLTANGKALVRQAAPPDWRIPVIGHAAADEAVPGRVRDAMTTMAFPLERWPPWDLRVTADGSGTCLVHLVIDLMVADARSIHLMFSDCMLALTDPSAHPRVPIAGYLQSEDPLRLRQRTDDAVAHWRRSLALVPPGPATRPATCDGDLRHRTRLEGQRSGWRAAALALGQVGLHPDAVLIAALTQALSELCPEPYTVEVIRWRADAEPARPGEFTKISWLPSQTGLEARERARHYQAMLDRDAEADIASGLAELRRLSHAERRGEAMAFPVVYTGLLDLSADPLPGGITRAAGLTCTPGVDLDCIVLADGDDLQFGWDVRPSAFDSQALRSAFKQFSRLVTSIGADQAETAAVDPQTFQRVIYDWNDTATDFPRDRLAHDLFERQVRATPSALALCGRGGISTSYLELDRAANRLAWRLHHVGVGPGTIVGISLPRGPELVAAVLGVLKAGGAYVPVDPSLPAERAGAMLTDCQVQVLVVGDRRPSWRLADPVLREVNCSVNSTGESDDRPPPRACQATDLAYVIFTSGSTGRPKGVAVTHQAVANLLNWCYRKFGFGQGDLGLGVTALGFDLSVFDIFGLLGCGAALYIADETEQHDPALLARTLIEQPVTFWNSAPTTLSQVSPFLARHSGAEGFDQLRLVFLSGDYTPLTLPGEIRAAFRNARVVSLGGATEATVWSNYFEVEEIDPQWRSIPYGRPIDNSRYYILDAGLLPCGIGTEGDLYIAGECLSTGYYRQPSLTAERFVPDPFAHPPGGRMYRTGDRAAYRADGNMIFLGRSDQQVKVRGFRVELGDIEYRLRQHEGVKDVVVLARKDHDGDTKLVAYVIGQGAATPTVRELRAFAADALPSYLVPNYVVEIASFPATGNGKLDRDALPWPLDSPGFAAAESSADRADRLATAGSASGDLVGEISALFAGFLDVASVSADADLWDLGATSFTIVQVAGEISQRYGHCVTVATLLAEPTVAAIARQVAGSSAAETAVSLTNADPDPGSDGSGDGDGHSDRVDFFSATDRARFKAAGHNRRPPGSHSPLPLRSDRFADEVYQWRASQRDFRPEPVPAGDLARLLGLLRAARIGARLRYLYPSAGDTYAVQTYLRVRPGGVAGLDQGIYYYRPDEDCLELVNPQPSADRTIHVFYNRPVFDRAKFELYLIGQSKAIKPLYDDADLYLAIEAGYMGQLLLTGQASCGIGLCPIGTLAFDRIRAEFELDDGHRLLHSFLGGAMDYQGRELAGAWPPRPRSATVQKARAGSSGDAAVVGAAGRYPGARDLATFWSNLASGRVAIGTAPPGRCTARGRESVPAGYLADLDEFDSMLFHISPAEARTLDPQARLLLHVVWECIEDAGYTPTSLRRVAGRLGVFVGAMWQDFQHVVTEKWRAGEPARIFAGPSEIASRISHFFGFSGPSLAVDTSCSSSLTALHLAMQSLRAGECGAAVVAGVNVLAHPYHLELLSDLGMTSSAQPAGAFDADSAGWIPGEGAGALLLRPVTEASQDRDLVRGVVESTWIGHVGGESRYATASSRALASSLRQVLRQAGIEPEDIDYAECAAAGAGVADAAEASALAEVFGNNGRRLPIGTIKPNLGHLEAASGLSQLTKVLLQFGHGRIAPTMVAAKTNPLISWDHLDVVQSLRSWPGAGRPARAIVNAVGASGSYAHAVLRGADAGADGSGPA